MNKFTYHTPGPWRVGTDYIQSENTGEIVVELKYQMANERSRHNKSVMSAAPDLFEVARQVVEFLDVLEKTLAPVMTLRKSKAYSDLRMKLEAAIRKAERDYHP